MILYFSFVKVECSAASSVAFILQIIVFFLFPGKGNSIHNFLHGILGLLAFGLLSIQWLATYIGGSTEHLSVVVLKT